MIAFYIRVLKICFSKNFKAAAIFCMCRIFALWRGKGSSLCLISVFFSGQLASLYVIFIHAVLYCLLHNQCLWLSTEALPQRLISFSLLHTQCPKSLSFRPILKFDLPAGSLYISTYYWAYQEFPYLDRKIFYYADAQMIIWGILYLTAILLFSHLWYWYILF